MSCGLEREGRRAKARSGLDTGRSYTGIDAEVFRILAAQDESRARMAAGGLKDTLRQIVALAAVYERKAQELAVTSKGDRPAAGQ